MPIPSGWTARQFKRRLIAQALTLDSSQPPEPHAFLAAIAPPNLAPALERKLAKIEFLLARETAPPEAIPSLGSGIRVNESPPFALYAFLRHPCSFEDCLWCAILNGGDRDTLGAMAGALSGALLGIEAILAAWRAKLENSTSIEILALDLLRQSGSDGAAESRLNFP